MGLYMPPFGSRTSISPAARCSGGVDWVVLQPSARSPVAHNRREYTRLPTSFLIKKPHRGGATNQIGELNMSAESRSRHLLAVAGMTLIMGFTSHVANAQSLALTSETFKDGTLMPRK